MRTDMSDLIPFHRTREANKRYAPSMYWGYVLSGVIPDIRQRTLTKHFLGREQKHEADAELTDVAALYRLKITGVT